MTDMSRRSTSGANADRDRILEQALTHELRGTEPSPDPALRSVSEGGCLDAETLAAWQDDALNAAEMATLELHVSTCARCQSMLAAFARGTATPLAKAPAEVEGFRWWRWWLAPIAAGATAAVLWMVVPEEQQTATAPPKPPAAAVTVDKVQPPAAFAEKKDAESPPAAAPPAASRDRAAELDTSAKLNVNALEDRQQRKDQAPAAAKEEAPVALAQPTAPAPAAPTSAAPSPAARAEAQGARTSELQKSARFAFVGTEIVAPDLATRWRAGDRGIERSTDAGATWTLVHQASDVTISAGAAPTSTVCWLASEAGFVYVSADGKAFTRTNLPPPPPDGGWSMRIVSIVATDARNATVVTADGTRFQTNDGGRNWRRIQA